MVISAKQFLYLFLRHLLAGFQILAIPATVKDILLVLEIHIVEGMQRNLLALKHSSYLERSAGVDMGVYSLCVPVVAVVTAQCLEVLGRGADNVQDQMTKVSAVHAEGLEILIN